MSGRSTASASAKAGPGPSTLSSLSSKSSKAPSVPVPVEALALSASVFLNDIDSWIPSTFGAGANPGAGARTAAEKEAEFSSFLRSERDGTERLGLGHPSFDEPSRSKQGGGSARTNGLGGLSKKLEVEKRAKARSEAELKRQNGHGHGHGHGEGGGEGDEDDEEEQEESRGRVISKNRMKRMGGNLDPFGGGQSQKKKNRAKDPFAVGNGKAQHPAVLLQASMSTADKVDGSDNDNGTDKNNDDDRNDHDNDNDHDKDNDNNDTHVMNSSRTDTIPSPARVPNTTLAESDSMKRKNRSERGTDSATGPRTPVPVKLNQTRGIKRNFGARSSNLDGEEEEEEEAEEEHGGDAGEGAQEQENKGGKEEDGRKSQVPSQTTGQALSDTLLKSKTQLRREKRKRAKLAKS
ncbi:hypothetical protein I316_01862 [Kwoniella heveanensis BCC8398]|uniref:Uncharacterized protein n=1 Tax=Kwoniella heveanensis BCC8398 TaxID=1296120 RepID=A0A1B9H020_9TREE|nr:hypothetical protein I316_01862 [Kwoniella heveanensis BCC8398]